MLVLTRKSGQSIIISGRIRLTVGRIAGNRVALALDAPRHVHIRRGELQALDERLGNKPSAKPPAVASRRSDRGSTTPK